MFQCYTKHVCKFATKSWKRILKLRPKTIKDIKKFKKDHNNFDIVRKKIIEVEERDHVSNFQPPISGEEIMELFNLKPSRAIGALKQAVKEACSNPNGAKGGFDESRRARNRVAGQAQREGRAVSRGTSAGAARPQRRVVCR